VAVALTVKKKGGINGTIKNRRGIIGPGDVNPPTQDLGKTKRVREPPK